MTDCIVYTRPGGKVSVTRPSMTMFGWLHDGGRWDGFDRGFADRQIDKLCEEGISFHAAWRYVRAMQDGGCTTAESWGITRDRFCAHLGTGCELWSNDDLPQDRWFRDAWRRSQNGGPIGISMPVARRIQLERIRQAAKDANADLVIGRWRDRIRQAGMPEELKQIWPAGLRSGH